MTLFTDNPFEKMMIAAILSVKTGDRLSKPYRQW